jgi:hypothetical protein
VLRALLPAAWLAAAVVLLLTAIPAAPDTVVRYNWDRCEPFVRNRDYEGPGHYTQTLSITGLPASAKFMTLSIAVNTHRETAWGFFQNGCPGPSRLVARPFVADCDTIPGLDVLAQWSRNIDGAADELSVEFRLDPAFLPDPLQRYGLATITFDHELAETDCYPAAETLCFLIMGGLCLAGDTFVFVYPEHDRLTWNDSAAEPDCAARRQGFVGVRPSSWGRVKSLYR